MIGYKTYIFACCLGRCRSVHDRRLRIQNGRFIGLSMYYLIFWNIFILISINIFVFIGWENVFFLYG